jgi:hypothetical protein
MNERALRQLAHVPRLAIQASSSETARDTNRTIILELIRLAGAVSRADLARLSGLQKSTVPPSSRNYWKAAGFARAKPASVNTAENR